MTYFKLLLFCLPLAMIFTSQNCGKTLQGTEEDFLEEPILGKEIRVKFCNYEVQRIHFTGKCTCNINGKVPAVGDIFCFPCSNENDECQARSFELNEKRNGEDVFCCRIYFTNSKVFPCEDKDANCDFESNKPFNPR